MRPACPAPGPARRGPVPLLRAILALLLAPILAAAPVPAAGDPPVPSPAPESWRDVILAHVERYPAMEPVDLYKLLHQGALGAEHAVPDEASARSWLEREIGALGDVYPGEPLVEAIAPGGAHLRVHLRPFLAAGGSPEALLHAFLETARRGEGPRQTLEGVLAAAMDLAEQGEIPWAPEVLGPLFAQLAAEGYPARHHSDAYRRVHAPAYRVISGDLEDTLPTTRAAPRR